MKDVSRSRGWDIHQVVCPGDLMEYNQNMYVVDRGYQLREHGYGLSTKAHFKKWYKHGHLGLCYFDLLN